MTKNQIPHIGQIAITVSEVKKVLPFYRDVLGLEFLFSAGTGLAFLQSGETRVMLSTPQGAGAEIGKNSVLYFDVEGIESSYEAMVNKGGTAERKPEMAAQMGETELWLAFLRDPDDNLVGLMEEKAAELNTLTQFG
ncbi:MAG: methylmalonyl-CoA/ethylmalonyl-CoA epimerase [Cellvibrionaceae bacterium]|jgi:methylmalonyl-CoA/ethylmalonyl-CoA epimerase